MFARKNCKRKARPVYLTELPNKATSSPTHVRTAQPLEPSGVKQLLTPPPKSFTAASGSTITFHTVFQTRNSERKRVNDPPKMATRTRCREPPRALQPGGVGARAPRGAPAEAAAQPRSPRREDAARNAAPSRRSPHFLPGEHVRAPGWQLGAARTAARPRTAARALHPSSAHNCRPSGYLLPGGREGNGGRPDA